MKRDLLVSASTLDVLALEDFPTPVPGDGGASSGIQAASVNRADIDYLSGKPFITRMGTGVRSAPNSGPGCSGS